MAHCFPQVLPTAIVLPNDDEHVTATIRVIYVSTPEARPGVFAPESWSVEAVGTCRRKNGELPHGQLPILPSERKSEAGQDQFCSPPIAVKVGLRI
jgi:hypothetical protein